MKIHTEERKYSCSYCIKTYKRAEHLNNHVHTSVHTKEKPFKCDKCDKQFTTSNALYLHKFTHEPPVQCEICKSTLQFQKAFQAI